MWTRFMDMHSGGGSKERWEYIYIEASEDEAQIVFFNRFGHNPERVSCTCCGDDYSISSDADLGQLTGYDRNLACVETPRDPVTGLYNNDDPNVRYLEAGESPPPGYPISKISKIGWKYGTLPMPLADYLTSDSVLVIRAEEIDPKERVGAVPAQGYVWAG